MHLLDFLFPRRCLDCGKIGKYFCQNCLTKIKFITHPICPVCTRSAIDGATHPRCQTKYTLDGLTSFFRYEGIVRKAIKAIKYRFVSDLAKEFIGLIPASSFQPITHNSPAHNASSIADAGGQPITLIPIPLHPTRLRFRGFNQAEVLGKLLAKRLKISVKTNILKRVRKTVPQVEMKDRKKRLQNMEGVFTVSPNPPAGGSQYPNILLFDDVFTTGATLRSAASMLKHAGVEKVWGVALAHG